jgi:ribosomal protein S10
MLLFKRNVVFVNLKKKKVRFYTIKFIYYCIKSKFLTYKSLISFNQVQISFLKLDQNYKIKLSTLNLKDLDTFIFLLLEKLSILKINSKVFYLPKQINIITVLRSPFIYKKSQDQLMLKKYSAILNLQGNSYNFFYQTYIEFLVKNNFLLLSKIQYNEIFL